MIAVLSYPDAVVIAALVAAFGAQVQTWRTQRKTLKETRPNGGSSMRDAIDRIERKLDTDVVPRLDHNAVVIAEHADRLAVIEAAHARQPEARTRKTDKTRTPRSAA